MVMIQALPDAGAWALGWDAVAAIATGLTLLGGLVVYAVDRGMHWRDAARRRRVVASGLLHTVTLTRNQLRATKKVLADAKCPVESPVELGKALLHHEGTMLGQHLQEIGGYGEQTACDLAYAVSLIRSIDAFARWLSSGDASPETNEQKDVIKENAAFFSEAASQALESLDSVERDLKKHVPKHIQMRRFGPSHPRVRPMP